MSDQCLKYQVLLHSVPQEMPARFAKNYTKPQNPEHEIMSLDFLLLGKTKKITSPKNRTIELFFSIFTDIVIYFK